LKLNYYVGDLILALEGKKEFIGAALPVEEGTVILKPLHST